MNRADAERFWAKVDKSGDCWFWMAYKDQGGYGKFKTYGRAQLAHRIAFTLVHGPIGDGLCVCHHCDNTSCVNPAHLFLGSPADNAADRDAKGRRTPPQGEQHASAKLTAAQVADIRARYTGKYGQLTALAREFPISAGHISKIVHGSKWKGKEQP